MKKKLLLSILIVIMVLCTTGCFRYMKSTKKVMEANELERFQANDKLMLRDHTGHYNEEGDKYIIEGTLVNTTDETLKDITVMFKVIYSDGTFSYYASCDVESLEPYGKTQIVAETPSMSAESLNKRIVRYELSPL